MKVIFGYQDDCNLRLSVFHYPIALLISSSVSLILNSPFVHPLKSMPGTMVGIKGHALTHLMALDLFPSAYANGDCKGGNGHDL